AIAATTTAWMFFALPQFPSSGIEKSNSVLGQQRADEGTARVVLKTAEPVDTTELAAGTTAAPLRAVADVERGPDAATEQSPMKAPPFSAMAHHEASPLKQQPIGGEDPTQHREGDAIKKPAPAPVAKEEAERSAAAPQQRQIHEKIPDTNAVAPP